MSKKSKRTGITYKGYLYEVTDAQRLMLIHLQELGFDPELEYRFCSDRQWRFDLYLRSERIGIECNGGRWNGGHFRGKAVDDEYEKLNRAQLAGVRVIQFTNEFISSGEAKAFLKEFL